MGVKLITITPDAERIMAYCARVSSEHQDNPVYDKLLKYCIQHQHWSIFETASMTLEIETSRAIAAQILRHKSFSFQEFSQRYKSVEDKPKLVVGRKQSSKNRQSSVEKLDPGNEQRWQQLQEANYTRAYADYDYALKLGVSREQARLLLPLATPTRLYMTGNIRSWIHWITLRTQPDTQLEHREIAEAAKVIIIQQLPVVSKALDWC